MLKKALLFAAKLPVKSVLVPMAIGAAAVLAYQEARRRGLIPSSR